MKKYSTAVDTVLLKATDFSVVNNKIYYKNEQMFWIYTVPSNTIAKLLTIDYKNRSITSLGGSSESILSKLCIKRPDGLIVYMQELSVSNNNYDLSDRHYYFNEGWSIGVKLSDEKFKEGQQLNFDLYTTLYFMIEYDSETIEIEERLNSLSSRVALLESKINS